MHSIINTLVIHSCRFILCSIFIWLFTMCLLVEFSLCFRASYIDMCLIRTRILVPQRAATPMIIIMRERASTTMPRMIRFWDLEGRARPMLNTKGILLRQYIYSFWCSLFHLLQSASSQNDVFNSTNTVLVLIPASVKSHCKVTGYYYILISIALSCEMPTKMAICEVEYLTITSKE